MIGLRVVIVSAIVGVVGTGLGGLLVCLLGIPSRRILSLLLGFAGGVMVSLVAFDLMPGAFEQAGSITSIVALVAGAIAVMVIDLLLPHIHRVPTDKESSRFIRTAVLVTMGIAMHNVPEGLAVGASLESIPTLGMRVAVMIMLHNVPEGVAVAGPMRAMGRGVVPVTVAAGLAGLPTILGAIMGAAVGVSPALTGFSLGFAAGAMLFITFDELIPEAQELAHGHSGTLGAVGGVIATIIISRLLSPVP